MVSVYIPFCHHHYQMNAQYYLVGLGAGQEGISKVFLLHLESSLFHLSLFSVLHGRYGFHVGSS
jgi:hypothetical protein